jgi:hypothetical protein
MLPFLEVAHLPSSSSFYSAILQPLGIRYLSTEDEPWPSIVFGSRSEPVFEIRQVTSRRPLRPSRITLSAPSAQAVTDTYEFALRANPDIQDAYLRHPSEAQPALGGASASWTPGSGGEKRVKITDYDGNIMAVVYRPPPNYPSHYNGATVRHTQSTDKEASRIVDWNYDVTASTQSSVSGSASGVSSRSATRRPRADDGPYTTLRRSVTDSPSVYQPIASPRQNSSGLSAGAVVGTLLAGAALGGALTYTMVKDRPRASRHDYDDAPSFTRRSTFPERYPEPRDHRERKGHYVEVERYPEEYAPVYDHRPPPEYITRYSQAGAPRSREVDDIYDDARGRHSSGRSRASVRARSETASHRQPLLLSDEEHRSYVSSRSSKHPPIVQRSYTYDTPERESYVSTRSQRSSSTVRAPPPMPAGSSHTVTRSKGGSRVTTTTIKVSGDGASPHALSRAGTYLSAREIALPPSRVGSSRLSARDVALPPSGVGSRRTRYEDEDDDGDADSIAPSDSISCVGGSRRSGRSYH